MKRTLGMGMVLLFCLTAFCGCSVEPKGKITVTTTAVSTETTAMGTAMAPTTAATSAVTTTTKASTTVTSTTTTTATTAITTTTQIATTTTITAITTTTTATTTTGYLRPEVITEWYDWESDFCVWGYEKRMFYDEKADRLLPYCLFLPLDYSPEKEYSVLLYLHGAGERGNNNIGQIQYAPNLYTKNGDLMRDTIMICPQCPASGWWNIDESYYGDEQGCLGSALRLLDLIQETYSCNEDRIYAMGYSMGGYATWSLLQRYPERFAAGVPVCGWGDTSKGAVLARIPIWIYHGTADPTVSFSQSQVMYDAIKRAGGEKVHFTKLQGVGHNAWDYTLVDREMLSWLMAQNKSENPTGDYEYVPAFRVLDANGNVVITENDVQYLSYLERTDGSVSLSFLLYEGGVAKLEQAYAQSDGKEFTVYHGTQKICRFVTTDAPVDNTFCLTQETETENFYAMYTKLGRLIYGKKY